MSDNIKVVVKVRPLISREIEDKLSYQWRVKNNTLYQLDQNGKDLGQSFTFDKVYDKDTKTSDVYDDIAKPIVEAATAGFNGTIFAYGQTSSGKTYTMTGTDSSPGIIPLAVINLFEIIKNVPDRDFLVRVSYIEIYNETVKDLLNVDSNNIKVHETLQGIKVDATEKVTSSPEEVLEAMKEGEANRQKGATNMNEQSSRSHSIFQITIESREHIEGEEEVGCVNVSQLNLVDLAGSERAGQTGATGIRFKEGTHINKSLSALALVIKQLSEDPNKFANYRDSKLTRILQNSLGGNAKTSIICAVTPAAVEETISTLQFANRAKAIKNKPEVNAVATDATMIQSLTKQMSKLQAQLESKKNLEQDNYKLQHKIANLQKLILNGFAQRRRVDLDLMSGTRRKLQQPRRITISTLHSIADEPVVPVPKFCTPSLKYNPLLVAPAERPPAAGGLLAPVPEEPRTVTPPPRHVMFSNEVIELDSSKTPPCILRRNAKLAEQNLKDLVELTDREKMYTPSVVEYIEKLEENSTLISKLQDEIEKLNTKSQEKDQEVVQLKSQIKKTEEDMKALNLIKVNLQTQCDNFNTKLTDWEVTYETLKKKAHLREEELLSLLEEVTVKNRKPDDMGKLLSRTLDKDIHFMDMSKDISLVNSDNEGSILQTNDNDQELFNDVVSDSQTQLALSSQTIIGLEADIYAQKQKVLSLQNINQGLEEKVSSCKDKLANMESENSFLKSTIDTLNSTIQGQKEHLETANNDIESYNNVIQELQIKLTQKQSLSNININDSFIENMIANEEQFIANNENMKNIINCLKMALDTRNKEIDKLKSSQKSISVAAYENSTFKEQLEIKAQEVIILNEEVNNLKKQINENIQMVTKLMHEKNDLKEIEHKLSQQLATFENKSIELEKINLENNTSLEKLKEENNNLARTLSDKNMTEQEITNNNKKNLEQINKMTNTIGDLEKSIKEKDDLIRTLREEEKESKEYLIKTKAAVSKLQLILGTLTGNMQEVPEVIDNFVNIFSLLSNSMSTLETVANSVIEQKENFEKNNAELKLVLEEQTSKYRSEIAALQEEMNTISKAKSDSQEENLNILHKLNQLNDELQISRNELNLKIVEYNKLEAELDKATENIKSCNKKIELLETERINLNQVLTDKENLVSNLTIKLEEIKSLVNDKILEIKLSEERLNNTHQEKNELLQSIFNKITDFTNHFNIQNNLQEEVENNCNKYHELIIKTLDIIGNHITFISSKNSDVDSEKVAKCNDIILATNQEIIILKKENVDLIEKLSEIEKPYHQLTLDFNRIQNENKALKEEILESYKIIQDAQTELKLKADDLSVMEDKLRNWKEQYKNLDKIMKQQMFDLKTENEILKAQIGFEAEKKPITYEHKDDYDVHNKNSSVNKRLESKSADISSPPSLLTICCNQIINYIQPKDVESKTTTVSSNAAISVKSDTTYLIKCRCQQLTLELNAAREENSKILDLLEQMEAINKDLIEEQEVVRGELQLLVSPAQELQKKIINHKHNLSILTALTNAENKSLKSQVKALQHHHSRFHNVCQRDIPDFKKQLRELLTLLKGDPSIAEQQNTSFKRYSLPDVLDSSTTVSNFKNESTLDGDALMLDTNITLNTAADNTLTGHDQTCLDLTQFYNEASCQTNDITQISDDNMKHMALLSQDNQVMYERLNTLKEENDKLRELVDKYSNITYKQSSPINSHDIENISKSTFNKEISVLYECPKCKKEFELQQAQENLNEQLNSLNQELSNIKLQKDEFEQKYNNLMLETPSTDKLVKKLSTLENDYCSKIQEIDRLNKTIITKNQELKRLQDENDSLSNEVMEHISETDDLNKELDNLKIINSELIEKYSRLEQSTKEFRSKEEFDSVLSCSECVAKDELIQALQKRLTTTHTKLNRSLSDSDTSSRYNKICTLQSELHAGREDCKELTEDVVTIKNHLERSNLTMDLDDSMGESNIYTFALQSNKCTMPDIQEERPTDLYGMEKTDCFNYYVEKTGIDKANLNQNVKIIEVMKMLYENLITKHGNEVENLTNKLKDYAESKNQLLIEYNNLVESNLKITSQLNEKELQYNSVNNILAQIKSNINIINKELTTDTGTDHSKIVNMYKDNFLELLDTELELSTKKIFESLIDSIVNKHQTDLTGVIERYTKLQEHMEIVSKELNTVSENLVQMKNQLSAKENEYNLLKAQKERIHEITNAVTLDIIKKDKELTETVSNGYKKLIELNIVNLESVDLTLPLNININLLFEYLVNEHKKRINLETEKDTENLVLEVKNSMKMLEEKQQEIELLRTESQKLQEINNSVSLELVDKENQLKTFKNLQEDFKNIYESKVEENRTNVGLINKLSEEVNLLKSSIESKERIIKELETKIQQQNKYTEKDVKIAELTESIKGLQDDVAHLKAMNEVITKEKNAYAAELLKTADTIRQNNNEMDKMTSDILMLRESLKENGTIIENLNVEAKNLLKQNMELKSKLEERHRECSQLETNIKTHETTAQIQTRMIMRLEKQKNEDDNVIKEKSKQIEELSQKYFELKKQCDSLHGDVKNDKIELLKKSKENLEARVSELEALLEGHKARPSIDAIADSSRQRRQSIYDSKRMFTEDKNFEDHNHAEAIFESRHKPDDLFMDVDEDMSNRSTPIRLSKGRDSLSHSRTDQSDKDEDHPSRPSSVVATRRRRQSTHDLHRSVLTHTPSPHGLELSNRLLDDINHSKRSDTSAGNDSSEVSQLRDRLASCQQELEDLKEKYRELDEECETCAEYLRERDEQCIRLKKEKMTLQATITELKEKQLCNPNLSQLNASKPSVASVAVNTDEDWTNLHSVVVDRMSFDAEVEKNKKLTKTIEELRFKKQDLKNTLAKMQKAFEKNGSREESIKMELQSCKQELIQLRERYKELDEECETCAQYLREKEEQCRKLKEAKAALEAKLQESQGDLSDMTRHSTRKKRQSLHDQNRPRSSIDVKDASTETSDDFLSYQVERDGSYRPISDTMQMKENKQLKLLVDKLSQQKTVLEQQLVSISTAMHAPHPMYVATGSAIVQNQQLTDVMKENQKLKKINAKLVTICKKRGKDSNRENQDPADQG